MRCAKDLSCPDLDNDDQQQGYDIVLKAIKHPFNTIAENAGLNGDIIWNNILDSDKNNGNAKHNAINTGYNIRTEKECDLFKEGIIDPTRVTRTAVEKAASVAGTMLTTECVITKTPEDKKDETPAGGFGMM
jgi:chaperonin GroEL